MPPKPRATRRPRAAANSVAAAAASPAEGAEESAAPTVMVPDAESKSAGGDSHVATSVEGQIGEIAEASASGTASGRKPVPRLESLKSMEPVAKSESPAVRRSASKGKKSTPTAPKPIATRRSKQERDALAKSLAQREKERLAEKRAEEKQKAREKPFKRPDRPQAKLAVPVGGPFSLGSVAKEKSSNKGITTFGGRMTRIKREDYEDGEGRSSSRAGGNDGGYISSGDDEADHIPRKDIDAIEISDDEHDGKGRGGSEPVTLLPVRIGRKEHVERTVAINTDASSEAAAKILQQAEATGGEIKVEDGDLVSKKGKGKAKDLEITGVRRPYKGMWQEEEDTDVAVKSEPLSDDETLPDAVPVSDTDLTGPAAEAKVGKGPTIRVRDSKKKQPILQTEEEKQEYERTNLFRTAVRFELGPDGDMTVEPRTESAYIFQLPPMMPKAAKTGDIKMEEGEESKAPGLADTKDGKKKKKAKNLEDPLKTTTHGRELGEVLVGKIRVHDSGRTTLRWGDKIFELIASNPTDSVGEIVETERVAPDQRVVPEDHGEGSDMGRVKGRFVVLPSWKAML